MASEAHDERITALALAAGRGDRTALEEFIRSTQSDVWRFIAHRASPARADDLTQETYLRALGSLRRFEARASARAWLLSIARYVCADEIRAAMARPRVAADADWEAAADRRRSASSTAAIEFAELRILLAALPEDRREALVLTQLLGLSYEEAAQVCGCPVGTIRSRVARAREDLLGEVRAAEAAGN